MAEIGRFFNLEPDQKSCQVCDIGTEGKFKFSVVCPICHSLRQNLWVTHSAVFHEFRVPSDDKVFVC